MTDWKRIKPVDDSDCVMRPTAKGWRQTREIAMKDETTYLNHEQLATIAILQIKAQIADLRRLEIWLESDKNETEFPTASEFVQNIAQNLGGIWGTVSEWEKTK